MPETVTSRRRRPCLRGIVMAVLVAAAIAACSASPTGVEVRSTTPRAPVDRSTTAATVLANSQLATDLYKQFARDHHNFAFSPYAVSIGLAEVGAGASGQTAVQLAEVQHVVAGLHLESGLNTLSQQIVGRGGDRQNDVRQGHVSIQIPIALWGQKDTHVKAPFLDALARWFGTGMRLVDFRSDPDSARSAMNTWVSDQTSGQVDELVGADQVSQATRLVLTTAAEIAAPWDQRFDATRTHQANFTLLDGRTEDATSMDITASTGLLYAKGDGWQSVMIPYLGRQLAMVLIVPDRGRFAEVEAGLDGPRLQQILDALQLTPLELQMPRFQFSTELDLPPALAADGVPSLFDPAHAQLPGITDDEALSLSLFDQQTFVSADEEGTQASAPTAIRTVPPGPPPTTSLVIDRPFLVAVVDRASGEPLILGRVVDPAN